MMKTFLVLSACILLVASGAHAFADTVLLKSGAAPVGQPDPSVVVYGATPLQQAVVINRAHPWWADPIPGTNWVSLSTGAIGLDHSYYYWETTFSLPDRYANPTVTASYQCDDGGINLMLNGIAWGGGAGFYPGDARTYSTSQADMFHPGINSLTFVVYNDTAWTGVDFSALVSYDTVPEPCAVGVLLTGLCCLGGLVRFRK